MPTLRSDLATLDAILHQAPAVTERSGDRLSGKRHGDWVGAYEHGNVAVQGRFHHGRRTGTWRTFADNGKPTLEMQFDHGVPHGTIKAWWPGGRVALEGRYCRGVFEAVKVWRSDGRPWHMVAGASPGEAAQRS